MKISQADQFEALAAYIALGGKATEFATERGIAPRTVQRWRADPALRARVREIRGDTSDQVIGILCKASRLAVLRIASLALKAKNEGVQLSAAQALLKLGIELKHAYEMEARVAELEADLAALKNPNSDIPSLPRIKLPTGDDRYGNEF